MHERKEGALRAWGAFAAAACLGPWKALAVPPIPLAPVEDPGQAEAALGGPWCQRVAHTARTPKGQQQASDVGAQRPRSRRQVEQVSDLDGGQGRERLRGTPHSGGLRYPPPGAATSANRL